MSIDLTWTDSKGRVHYSSGKLLRLSECSERTGHPVSTWRAWILRRKIPYYKVFRSVRVAESDLEKFIQQSLVPAREPRR